MGYVGRCRRCYIRQVEEDTRSHHEGIISEDPTDDYNFFVVGS